MLGQKFKKKGVSEIVAYVLIVGMAVAIGTVITVWYRSTTERQVEGILTPIEGSSQCADVNVNVAFGYDDCSISVYNTGSALIKELKITYTDDSGGLNTTDYAAPSGTVPPRLSTKILLPTEGISESRINTVNIVPIIV